MGKKNNNKRTSKGGKKKENLPRITMKDINEVSDDEEVQGTTTDGFPPEEEWGAEAVALRNAIEGGKFDHLLEKGQDEEDEESIEEASLEEDDDDNDDAQSDSESASDHENISARNGDDDEEEVKGDNERKADASEPDEESSDSLSDESASDNKEKTDPRDENSSDNDNNDSDIEEDQRIAQRNQVSSKALHAVTKDLIAGKDQWDWSESFTIIASDNLDEVPVHDDLKREVAFYDLALDAVQEGRERCSKEGILFERPQDFFVEMVKSDEHMARIKDRLIFETKKMDAVAQRKSNKEQKLRAKESHANRLADRADRKREAADQAGSDKKRRWADKKYGFGGKRGRFKQNDSKTMNDMSGYNKNGNFEGGMKRKGGSGANRKGKRARDAMRARKS